MSQETMNIALPDNLKEYVLRQVADGGYTSASEYVRELIRSDQKRKA
jgi:antitoxin ParD1/3/4